MMKYFLFVCTFAIAGCGTEMPTETLNQDLDEESYAYPESSFDPDEGEWSSSEYGSGGGSGSGYGDMDAGFDCTQTPCLYGTCGTQSEAAYVCECQEGYGGERCDTCDTGYAAIGCDDCSSDFQCVPAEGP